MFAKQRVFWAIVILAGIGIAGYRTTSADAQQDVPPLATRWEYQVISQSANTIASKPINQLGKEGWELVTVVPNSGNVHLYFKRPR
ncbi:DUF4177 domain-containing protein [Aeoliella sp.]|uniref:DUF4177 domain-containing protein n=1 Tax=Aeoliella sp. TaxID=2795800 RepID=UPI003CCBA080